MPYQIDSPLAAGIGAAASTLQGFAEAKNAKAERDRQAELDRQHAIAVAAAQAHQQFEEGRETKGDVAADDDRAYNRKRQAPLDAIAITNAANQAKMDKISIARAEFENSPQMQHLQTQKMIYDNMLQHNQIDRDRYSLLTAKADADVAQLRAAVAKKYGFSDAELAQESTRAGIDSTRASTDATRQGTSFAAQEEPTRQAQGRANLIGTNLQNVGSARSLEAPASNPALNVDPKDPHAHVVETDTATNLKRYAQQQTALEAKIASGDSDATLQPDGTYKTSDGKVVLGKQPEDFESYSSALDALMTDVQKNPKALAKHLKEIDAQSDMTPAQKSYAKRRLIDASKTKTAPASGGGPVGATPFWQV